MTDMEVGATYRLKDGHSMQKYKKVDRRELRYEGEAPGPEPAGWFIDPDSQKFHAFRLSDVVKTKASSLGVKGRTRSGRRKRKGRTKRKR